MEIEIINSTSTRRKSKETVAEKPTCYSPTSPGNEKPQTRRYSIIWKLESDLSDTSMHPYGFKYFQSCLFATVLEDTIHKIRILGECNTEIRIDKMIAEMKILLENKYGVSSKKDKIDINDIDPKKLDCIEYKMKKLEADRDLLNEVFTHAYYDLAINNRFEALNNYVNNIVDQINYDENQITSEAKNKQLLRDVYRQLRQQRIQMKTVTYEVNSTIDKLTSLVENAALKAATCCRYIENWQQSRIEQHEKDIFDKEERPASLIEQYKLRTDNEQLVHTEMDMIISIITNETLTEVEFWMNKYEKDVEKVNLRIAKKKGDYEHLCERKRKLEDIYEEHAREMNDWVTFTDERERVRRYEKKMDSSAIIIQAWWRGLLVRQQMGPYKVVKKRGAAPKAKK